jgi:hypothetical protein
VLQELSFGMRDLLIALFATYLINKTSYSEESKLNKLKKLIKKQESKLDELSKLIAIESDSWVKKQASQRLGVHLQALAGVKNFDPSIEKLLEETAHLLKEEGKKGLAKRIE